MIIARAMCGLTYVTVAALCSSCSLQKYVEWWPTASKEAGRPVLILMTGPKILRTELNAVHLYRHYSLFMHNKLQYTWRGDYCEYVQPAQLLVLTWSSSSVPPGKTSTMRSPWDRAGYNNTAKLDPIFQLQHGGVDIPMHSASEGTVCYVFK